MRHATALLLAFFPLLGIEAAERPAQAPRPPQAPALALCACKSVGCPCQAGECRCVPGNRCTPQCDCLIADAAGWRWDAARGVYWRPVESVNVPVGPAGRGGLPPYPPAFPSGSVFFPSQFRSGPCPGGG